MPYQNVGALKPYYQLLDEDRLPIATVDPLTPEMELIREVSSCLRFTRLDLGNIQRRYGVDLDYVFGDLITTLQKLSATRWRQPANDGESRLLQQHHSHAVCPGRIQAAAAFPAGRIPGGLPGTAGDGSGRQHPECCHQCTATVHPPSGSGLIAQ